MTRRNHPTVVEPEQVWSALFMGSGAGYGLRARIEIRVDRIAPHPEGLGPIAHCVSLATGKAFEVRVFALANHLRGARLVRHANGQPATVVKAVYAVREEPAPKRKKDKLPRGLRELTPRDIRIRELRAQGVAVVKIAARVGLNEKNVREALAHLADWAAYEAAGGEAPRAIGMEKTEAELRGHRRAASR